MNLNKTHRTALACGLLIVLAACSGDDEAVAVVAPPPVSTDQPTNAERQAAFSTDYGSGLTALNTFSGLNSSAFVDLFDETFLDAGYTKPQVRDSLALDATALAVAGDLSGSPQVKLSGGAISNCNASGVCTFTGTLTNADADTTAVQFSTQVKYSNGKFRLLGDQKAA